MKSSRLVVLAFSAVLACGAAAFADDYDLDALRAATEKYKDVNVALAEGFIADPSGHCVSAEAEGLDPALGAMGIHYIHPAMLKITGDKPRVDGESTHTDFMKPAILLYEPQADGSLILVGIENLVFEKAWTATHGDPPVINGRTWDHMADNADTEKDEAHGFMPHYDQHVWLFRANPSGDLEPFNAAVTCEHHKS
ncbi:hypothetical protein HPQ64_06600 [Rhizobiales bacterium]|uniref:hypothetical protein n=1 Tax=Hongsoonwoonella zoysiae TaxID=2821844 RepID=UPI00156185A6|nr:hypothetical protein [Hongsoonwoonella zoysiae]NRG17351.1 hypothetical protein [Hongsoonwoonella zoysiae]